MAGTRRYSMGLRDEQTAATRGRILDAARDLFTQRGYLRTTLTTVAEAAGVSVQTIYNLVGGKPVLLKTVYDVTLAGDDEAIPMAERPIARAVLEAGDGRECLARYAVMGRVLGERVLPLITAMLAQAATGDHDLRTFADTIETERATATRGIAGHVAKRFGLRDGLDVQTAADILWTLTAAELTDRLVNRRGWSWDRYERWLGSAMADLLLGPA
ncbi:MAG TPA: helix-turn-helix domain-containing protein [Actinophytocola sp.]|uniref:TetR/AcrR family transcriptional regulator n=1 Tax=Actinophytocola sp. TaxID=1872138 RepID=UPI002DDD7D2C|nr:helix-turn-helix domain-containing protein [Actinophytocola sp.]HEV2778471.1 helix-turn-helix domain-containing protein [Actinophytocola sp.]